MSLKVTSTETISFPQYEWGIEKGAERELPTNKDAQAVILANEFISEVGAKKEEKKKVESKEDIKN